MVELWWLPLERDFSKRGIRAMDWFEHKRDWREFYRLKQDFGRGSAIHTAMSNDPDYAEETANYMRSREGRARKAASEMSPEGFDDRMHKLCDIEDRLAGIAAGLSGGDFQPARRPRYLAEKLAEQKSRAVSKGLASQLLAHNS